MTKFTIHYLNGHPVMDLSDKGRVAIYDAKEGGTGISITRERFEKLIKAYQEQQEVEKDWEKRQENYSR